MRRSILFVVPLVTMFFVLGTSSLAEAQAYCSDCSLDIDGSGTVDPDDHALCFLQSSPTWSAECAGWDLNGDLFVTAQDLSDWVAACSGPFVCVPNTPALSLTGRLMVLLIIVLTGAATAGFYKGRKRHAS